LLPTCRLERSATLPDSATRTVALGSIAAEIANAYSRFVIQVFPDA
jgi:hypothetical protein